MQRILEPELLDSLAPDDPAALHNRRDLRLTNALMGNHRWLARTLARQLFPGERVLELGAGMGEFGLRLAARNLAVAGLDLWPRPKKWPAGRAWHQADLRTFAGYGEYAVVFGNLIFHQFSDDDLAALGRALRGRVRAIVACEPVRRRASQILFAAIAPALGANHVSLYDARASIAAGFRGDELPRALGLAPAEWDCRCATTLLGAYRMVAVRRA